MSESWKPVTRLDDLREKLRKVVFWYLFTMAVARTEGRKDDEIRDWNKASALIEFGVHSGLWLPTEESEWLDVLWERQALTAVAMKYMTDGVPTRDEQDRVKAGQPL